MAIVSMQKVAILASRSYREQVIETLHEVGLVELSETSGPPAVDHTEMNFQVGELTFAIDTLQDVASKETVAASQKTPSTDDILTAPSRTDVRAIVDTLHELEAKDTEAEGVLQAARQTIASLKPWVAISGNLDAVRVSTYAELIFGEVPTMQKDALLRAVHSSLSRVVLEDVSTAENVSYMRAIVWTKDKEQFEEIVTTHGWTTTDVPSLSGNASALYEEAVAQEKEALQTKQESTQKRQQLSHELPQLLHVKQYMLWLKEKQSAREGMAETYGTVSLLGWMPRKRITELEQRLEKISPAVAILKVKADEGEEAPVLLQNARWITPFESVTNLYGLPRPNEFDPTSALSLFFILYFSLCLTDAGYGIVLAIMFGGYVLKTNTKIADAPLLWLLFLSGIVTFLVGILFGGWFGLQAEQVPTWLTKETADGLMFKGQIWNLSTTKGIDFLQNLSMILGITHLFFGMFLSGLHKWLHNQKVAAFWEDFTSHILLGAVIFFFAAPESMATVAKWTLIAAAVAMIWGKGHGSAWYLRPLMGLLGTVNFGIGLLSNGLSYLRILALGLVTGAIALAVNQVAIELGKLFPIYLGIPVIILVFIGGHLVSIALNTLGSFIHSGRLQFIEFFSQFFEGGGRPFSPFRRSNSL